MPGQLTPALLLMTLVLTLSACGPTKPEVGTGSIHYSAETLLEMAQRSAPPQSQAYQIQAAEVLFEQDKGEAAAKLLAAIEGQALPIELFTRYSLIYSAVALQRGDYFLAREILTRQQLQRNWNYIVPADQAVLLQRRAEVLSLLGEPMESLTTYMDLYRLVEGSEQQLAVQEGIWKTLLTIPTAKLDAAAFGEKSFLLKGWLELALAVRGNQEDIGQQLQAVHRWVAKWPQHPASFHLPDDIQQLEQLIENRPKTVALLLPHQGKLAPAAEAIRDGLMAAFFSARQRGFYSPKLVFIDSSRGTLDELYQQALALEAEWVIGPLSKNLITELSQRETLPLPTLALNYDKLSSETPRELYQFGLAVEDEVAQVAQQAWLEGHRNAALITPKTQWGSRASKTFSEYWTALGGTVVAQSEYGQDKDYSRATGQMLQTDRSQARARQLQQTTGLNLQSESRRRQDIDCIFMAAGPQDGRQLKPTFAYHYASTLPVYATSAIYDGAPDRAKDRDLNKVRFTTLPWYFTDSNNAKNTLTAVTPEKAGYGKLYALGIDAYQLYTRLPLLERMTNAAYFGLTGALQLDERHHIVRHSQWAFFRSGRVYPQPAAIEQPVEQQ